MKRNKPKTELRFDELLGDHKITDLANCMGVTYTKLYPYRKEGANPTLKGLEELANGFTELLGKKIEISDLLVLKNKKSSKVKSS